MKLEKESIISSQLARSGTSIGANIHEAQYAHGKADFVEKLQIALKEANEKSYWLTILNKTSYLNDNDFKELEKRCGNIRMLLISSINTTKNSQ